MAEKSKEEILKIISDLDNVELLEDVSDSWKEEPKVNTEEIEKMKTDYETLKKEHEDLKVRYKERFFTKEEPKEPTKEEGLHEEEVKKIENIFKEVKK